MKFEEQTLLPAIESAFEQGGLAGVCRLVVGLLNAQEQRHQEALAALEKRHQAVVAQLEARIAELEKRLGKNSSNSSKPPSSDGLKRNRSLRNNRSGRKPGGQPGHAGQRLHPSAKPDAVTALPLTQCPQCQGDLSEQPVQSEEVRQVFELPPMQLRVTEYRAARKRCPHCGRLFTAEFPAGVTAPTQYGPGMQAVMSYLQAWQLLPHERTAQSVLRDPQLILPPPTNKASTSSTPSATPCSETLSAPQLVLNSYAKASVGRGRAAFERTCIACHTLYGAGGIVGPDLTGSNRANLDYILAQILNPSEVMQESYQLVIVNTRDGRTLAGMVAAEDNQQLTLRLVGQDSVVTKSEILSREKSPISMMPEGLLKTMSNSELRDLIAYLRTSAQVPLSPLAPSTTPDPLDSQAANPDEFPDLQGWKPRACTTTTKDGIVTVTVDGQSNEPLLVFRGAMQGPTTLKFRARSTKGGEGRASWFTISTDQKFRQSSKEAKPESATFKLTAGDWQEVTVSTPATGTFIAIRLFFPIQQQSVEIDWIESESASEKKRWNF